MLAIRMQRTGRKGHAEFRIIVQESSRTPTSGSIVMQLGHYNPHAKIVVLDKVKTSFYLDHGAQPSDSVVRLLQKEAIKLPSWVKLATTKSRTARHPEKLRKNQLATPAEPVVVEVPAAAETSTADAAEAPATETGTETAAEDTVVASAASGAVKTPAEAVAEDTPAAAEAGENSKE